MPESSARLPSPKLRTNPPKSSSERKRPRPVRCTHPIYSIAPTREPPEPETTTPTPVFKVKPTTFDVFATLFTPPEARSIKWTAFESAMADLNLSMMPNFGPVVTFFPPQEVGTQKPITSHRPHHPRLEGFRLLVFARRLRRRFGRNEKSFEVA